MFIYHLPFRTILPDTSLDTSTPIIALSLIPEPTTTPKVSTLTYILTGTMLCKSLSQHNRKKLPVLFV